MKTKFISSLSHSEKVLIVPIYTFKKSLFTHSIPQDLVKVISAPFKAKDFECKDDEMYTINGEQKLIFISLGEKEKLDSAKVRNAFANGFKKAKSFKKKTVAVFLYAELEKFAQEIAEGMFLSDYEVAKYKTGEGLEELKKAEIEEVIFITKDEKRFAPALQKGLKIAEAVNAVKEMTNAPANILSPKDFAEKSQKLAKKYGYKIEILEKKALQKLGLNTLLAVNAGADKEEQEARLVILKYMPIKNQEPIAIVGKGVTFDTGGYNLKPSKHLDDMQGDKAGACAVFGLFELLSQLKIQQNVIGVMAITENLVGPRAFKPADIVTSYSGKTIEIVDTDAEGRLILADALAYANKNFKPRYIIDLATLTGACVVALGDRFAATMGNDDKLNKLLIESGKRTDELVWELPMHPDFDKKTKSKIADLQNVEHGSGYMAGSSKGGAFLKHFVDKTKWAHLDIAGTAFTHDPKPYEQDRATGFGVRLLVDFLENLK
ncbi:MAG: hypothetical protein US89_C0005G0076 [Candidatus Peregrinibacteria bacterium GW2011_GWF2_38_29]|nr:MAG: hypothetical protein US89_C0005G0076 [Candidatus Peregrinibacteria bacterium GW2011_GWF2_38_29]HBB02663.1 leucyl aminopeptidase [Candidatus Peregrinibacteria bacterium]